ncbi:hypothetical protein LPJ72_003681 [Coemansia sp. Benny D160-2]|nr:hypothetical protein LPJ72_003681 [Coemansia sp. Benny D160-2]
MLLASQQQQKQQEQHQGSHRLLLTPSPRQAEVALSSTSASTETSTPLQVAAEDFAAYSEDGISKRGDSIGIEDDVVMSSGDENDRGAIVIPVISGEQDQTDDNQPVASERALTEEQSSAPIRSLTALALSPTQQQASRAYIGGDGDDDDERNIVAALGGSESLLRSLLERIHNIEQYCRQLVQMQTQQAQHISALEAAIQSTASTRVLSPQPGAFSTAVSESGAISAATTASAAAGAAAGAASSAGTHPRSLHTLQIHQAHGASRSVSNSAAVSPRAKSHSPVVSAGTASASASASASAVFSSSLPAATPMHEQPMPAYASGSQQVSYRMQYPQSAVSAGNITQHRLAHEEGSGVSSEEALIQQQERHRRGSFGLQQTMMQSSSLPHRRYNPYHANRADPYSARTSPTAHTQKQASATAVLSSANFGSFSGHRTSEAFSAAAAAAEHPLSQHRVEPVPSAESARGAFQVSGARSRRGSLSAHHSQYRGRHHISPSSSSFVWSAPQHIQQQQQQQQPTYQYAVSEEGLHVVAPYAQASQPQQHDASAFGYMAPSASASVSTHASATGSSSGFGGGGNSGEQYSVSQRLYAANSAAARAKRPRVTDVGSALLYSSLSGASNESAGGPVGVQKQQLHLSAHPQMAPSHGHGSHNILPPIRSSTAARGSGSSSGNNPSAALGHGRMADGRDSSLSLGRPDMVALQHSAHVGKDSKGKMPAAVMISGMGGSSASAEMHASTGEASSSRMAAYRTQSVEAQPTPAWLAAQRRYKVGLLHLLTLDSFYPTDIAMMNMFRALGDFSSEQIEAHGATLLSWARSWLRYNRNAVLRSTLENKAKVPLSQLAEALQHDLHAETDFTTVQNLQRCALLRLIYFQWQAINKLGTKSQSLYRDYEIRLREIDALPTVQDQEAEWTAILEEEQARRLALIRESRGSGGSAILPRPEQHLQQRHQTQPMAPQSSSSMLHYAAGAGVQQHPQQQKQQPVALLRQRTPSVSRLQREKIPVGLRHTLTDWTAQPVVEAAMASEQQQQQQYSQHYAVASMDMAGQVQQQQQQHEAIGMEGIGQGDMGRGAQAVGKDDDSEMSVNLSPEPHH